MFGFFKKSNKEEIEKAKKIVLYFDKVRTQSRQKGHANEPFADGTTKLIPLENGKYFKDTSTEWFYKGKPVVDYEYNPKYPLKIFENNPDKTINQHYFYSISLLKYSVEELKNAFKIDYQNSKKRQGETARYQIRLSILSHFMVHIKGKDELMVKEVVDEKKSKSTSKGNYLAERKEIYQELLKESDTKQIGIWDIFT
ncbi:hypothetical protein N8782_00580 [Methylophilaceae bacterium]|nr:hypothetical protein [Methylophilaceae bacterium]